MDNKKMPIDVIVEDDRIAVRCCHGEWNIGGLDNRWLWVLGAIAFPEEHSIKISDLRKNREDHQKDMTTQESGGKPGLDEQIHAAQSKEEKKVREPEPAPTR